MRESQSVKLRTMSQPTSHEQLDPLLSQASSALNNTLRILTKLAEDFAPLTAQVERFVGSPIALLQAQPIMRRVVLLLGEATVVINKENRVFEKACRNLEGLSDVHLTDEHSKTILEVYDLARKQIEEYRDSMADLQKTQPPFLAATRYLIESLNNTLASIERVTSYIQQMTQ